MGRVESSIGMDVESSIGMDVESSIGMDVDGIMAQDHKSSRAMIAVETPVCPEVTPLGAGAILLTSGSWPLEVSFSVVWVISLTCSSPAWPHWTDGQACVNG